MNFKNINNIDNLLKQAGTVNHFDREDFHEQYNWEFANNFEIGEADADPYHEPADPSVGVMQDTLALNASITATTHLSKDNLVEILFKYDTVEKYISAEGLPLLDEVDIIYEIVEIIISAIELKYPMDHQFIDELKTLIEKNLTFKITGAKEKDRSIYLTIVFEVDSI